MFWQRGNWGNAGRRAIIYEKEGKKEDAQRAYALALTARRPELQTRSRLAALVGGDAKVDAFVDKYHVNLEKERTLAVGNSGHASGKADFFLLVAHDQDSPLEVERVAFIDGDEALKPLTEQLQNVRHSQLFPDDTPVKILRRGTLSCKTDGDCAFQLALPDDVKSVD